MNAFVNDNLKKRLLKPPFYFFSNLHSSIEVEKRGIKDGRGKPFSLSLYPYMKSLILCSGKNGGGNTRWLLFVFRYVLLANQYTERKMFTIGKEKKRAMHSQLNGFVCPKKINNLYN